MFIVYLFIIFYVYWLSCCLHAVKKSLVPSKWLNRHTLKILSYCRGADKSLARPDWKKKQLKSSPFFSRRGDHCCRGDLVGRTNFGIVSEWVAKVTDWSL